MEIDLEQAMKARTLIQKHLENAAKTMDKYSIPTFVFIYELLIVSIELMLNLFPGHSDDVVRVINEVSRILRDSKRKNTIPDLVSLN